MKQPWLSSSIFDSLFILLPPFLTVSLVWIFSDVFQDQGLSELSWIILILLVDVAHVYSTLYRTYFDQASLNQRKQLYVAVPIICYVSGVMAYSFGPLTFWRVLAYLAVFHFVRQQYGFLRLYSRTEKATKWARYLDMAAIYLTTIYPLVYWHTHPDKPFNWFVEGDFFFAPFEWLEASVGALYIATLFTYFGKELYAFWSTGQFNIPKNLVMLGTALSWYIGIVALDSDMAFTTINVIAHGIPYMALIYAFGRKNRDKTTSNFLKMLFTESYGILVFLGILFLFAYFEEGLWDAMVWKDHKSIFPSFHNNIPHFTSLSALSLIVPLLSLPQVTHYVLDGFIWKLSGGKMKDEL